MLVLSSPRPRRAFVPTTIQCQCAFNSVQYIPFYWLLRAQTRIGLTFLIRNIDIHTQTCMYAHAHTPMNIVSVLNNNNNNNNE